MLLMTTTKTPTVLTAEFSEAIEAFRKYRLECLETNYKRTISDEEEHQLFGQELQLFGNCLVSLTTGTPTERFQALTEICRDGWSDVFFPELHSARIDAKREGEKLVALVFDGDNFLGAIQDEDLNY